MKALGEDSFGAKPVSRTMLGLLWAVPALMAMDGPGCVMSERPLARGDGIDERLLGEWVVEGDPDAKLALRVGLVDADTIEIRSIESDGSYIVLTGYTSTIGEASYASLQFVDAGCIDCSPAELAAIKAQFETDYADVIATDPANDCTHLIVRYALDAEGRLRHFGMEPRRMLEVVESGELAGEGRRSGGPAPPAPPAPDEADGFDYVCVTASADDLRSYVRDNGLAIFADESEVMVRRQRL